MFLYDSTLLFFWYRVSYYVWHLYICECTHLFVICVCACVFCGQQPLKIHTFHFPDEWLEAVPRQGAVQRKREVKKQRQGNQCFSLHIVLQLKDNWICLQIERSHCYPNLSLTYIQTQRVIPMGFVILPLSIFSDPCAHLLQTDFALLDHSRRRWDFSTQPAVHPLPGLSPRSLWPCLSLPIISGYAR